MSEANTSYARPWTEPAIAGVEAGYDDRDVMRVKSSRNSYFYVSANREDRDFRTKPPQSSFPFCADSRILVSTELRCDPSVDAKLVLVEYNELGDRVFFFEPSEIDHVISPDTTSLTFAVRVQGVGNLELGSVRVQSAPKISSLSKTIDVTPGDSVRAEFDTFSSHDEPGRAALVTFAFTNQEGQALLPNADLAVHPHFGLYSYLDSGHGGGAGHTEVALTVPGGATTLTIAGVLWNKEVPVFLQSEPKVSIQSKDCHEEPEESIKDFLESIPSDEQLVVLYTTAPQLGHPTLALRPNRLAKEYNAMNRWVVFFPFSKVPPGESDQGEKVRQFSRSQMSEFLDFATRRKGANNVFICSSFPDISAVAAIDLLRLQGWKTTYEVRDDMEEFNRVGYSKWFHPQLEKRVSQRADTVITVSPRLAAKMDIIRGEDDFATVVPNAVEGNFIRSAAGNRSAESYSTRSGLFVAGYIGHLTPSWFDWQLIIDAGERMPHVRFEIIGHGKPEDLELPANVVHLGPKTHREFIDISMGWKVGLIPFKPSTLTYAVDPNKIYEYLAVGLRTVTALMGSVELCPSTYIYGNRGEFVTTLQKALNGDFTKSEIDGIESFLEVSTWSARAESMLDLMGMQK